MRGTAAVNRADLNGGDHAPPFTIGFNYIQNHIHGRMAMLRDEYDLFMRSIPEDCLYLEIGTLWGGSAIAAAQKARRVLCIDPMKNYKDAAHNYESPPVKTVLENFYRFGVSHKISIIMAKSTPWPLPPYVVPDVAYIDGDHSYDSVLSDWLNASKITKEIILMHDNNRSSPGVQKVIKETAINNPDWMLVETVRTMAKFSRR